MDHPSRLVLVRHAQSERNVAKKGGAFYADDEARRPLHGVSDDAIALTAEGRRQAVRAGEALRERFGAFACVYNSGYRRTVETTEGILSAFPEEERAAVEVRQSIFIRERDAGYGYDMTTAEAEAAFPWLSDYWNLTGPFFARPPGGESVAQVCERVHLFLDMLSRERAGQQVLVVTHDVTVRAFRYLLERWTNEDVRTRYRQDPPHNASVTVYEHDAGTGRLMLREYNTVHWRDV
jgi:2,3-bisphosphoglycerate-dependent phosphoglycerate mutase